MSLKPNQALAIHQPPSVCAEASAHNTGNAAAPSGCHLNMQDEEMPLPNQGRGEIGENWPWGARGNWGFSQASPLHHDRMNPAPNRAQFKH